MENSFEAPRVDASGWEMMTFRVDTATFGPVRYWPPWVLQQIGAGAAAPTVRKGTAISSEKVTITTQGIAGAELAEVAAAESLSDERIAGVELAEVAAVESLSDEGIAGVELAEVVAAESLSDEIIAGVELAEVAATQSLSSTAEVINMGYWEQK
jgi:hypothetical protein